jgi:hypothetical protein
MCATDKQNARKLQRSSKPPRVATQNIFLIGTDQDINSITQKSQLMKTIEVQERKDFKAILLIAGALVAAQVLAFIYVLTQ